MIAQKWLKCVIRFLKIGVFRGCLMYHSFKQLDVELYTDEKSPDTESRVEEVLTQHNIYYTKTESWIESEKLYEVLYEMEV